MAHKIGNNVAQYFSNSDIGIILELRLVAALTPKSMIIDQKYLKYEHLGGTYTFN